MSTLILRTTTRLITPGLVVISLYLLWRGHNAPGGGFIAGLVAGAAIVLQYLAFGVEGINRLIPISFRTLVASGLLVALGAGVGGYLVAGAFLGSHVYHYTLPLVGEQEVAYAFGFDVGVYLIVVATVLSIVKYLGSDPDEEDE